MRYYRSVYCRFRDEARYLREWLEFHLLVGVHHFYLIDHLSTDNPLAVLQPYIDKGLVTYTRFTEELPAPGTTARKHVGIFLSMNKLALGQAKGQTEWLAVIDSDEYLVPVASESLPTLLKRYEAYPALAVNWQMFGTAGRERISEDRLLCESLTLRAPRHYHQNQHVKLIIRPHRIISMEIHSGHFRQGVAVDTNRQPVRGNFNPVIPTNVLRLHHYFLRDREFMRTTKVPRRRSFSHDADILPQWDWEMSQEPDDLILRYVTKLRHRVFPHLPPQEPLPALVWPDWQYYQTIYPENSFTSPEAAYRHWFMVGSHERRLLPRWQEYLAANPELLACGITTAEQASTHWYSYGAREGRLTECK